MIIHVFCISYILELNFVFTKTLASITGAHDCVTTFWFYSCSILWLRSHTELTLSGSTHARSFGSDHTELTLSGSTHARSFGSDHTELTSSHEDRTGCSGPCILAEQGHPGHSEQITECTHRLRLNLRNELHLWSFDLCRALFGYEGSTDVLKVISKGGKTKHYFFHSSIILVKLCSQILYMRRFGLRLLSPLSSPPNHATQKLSADSGNPELTKFHWQELFYYCFIYILLFSKLPVTAGHDKL